MNLLHKFVIIWLILCLAGLGGTGIYYLMDNSGTSASAAPKKNHDWATWTELNDGAWEARFYIHQHKHLKTLLCVEDNYEGNSGGLTMSCDWGAFNR